MLSQISQILTVARNTFTESLRQPISLVLLLLTLGILALNPAVSGYTLEDDDKLLRDIGLSTVFVAGLFLAVFIAAGALAEEIRKKTVLAVVSKPVSRTAFLIGKYVGASGAVGLALLIWSSGLLLTLRHGTLMTVRDPYHEPVIYFGIGAVTLALLLAFLGNYFRGYVFSSAFTYLLAIFLPTSLVPAFWFDAKWNTVVWLDQFDGQLLIAILLIGQALAILCAIAVMAATRLGQMTTLTVCSIVFVAGLTAEYFLGTLVDRSIIARVAYALVPNLQYLWTGEALLEGRQVSGLYVLLTSCYTVLYVTATLGVATLSFRSRDVG